MREDITDHYWWNSGALSLKYRQLEQSDSGWLRLCWLGVVWVSSYKSSKLFELRQRMWQRLWIVWSRRPTRSDSVGWTWVLRPTNPPLSLRTVRMRLKCQTFGQIRLLYQLMVSLIVWLIRTKKRLSLVDRLTFKALWNMFRNKSKFYTNCELHRNGMEMKWKNDRPVAKPVAVQMRNVHRE